MRLLHLPFLIFLSLLSFTTALPVDVKGVVPSAEFLLRDDITPAPVSPLEFEKRELFLLTQLFKSVNNSAGISLIKGAATVPLTQQQIIKFAANLIETKGLETLLKVADNSNLALDLVLMILTHYETIPGLTAVVKKYKGTATTSSGSGSGTSGLSSTSSTGSGSSSSSGSGGLLGTVGNIVGGIVGGIGSIFGLGGSSSGSSGSTAATSTTARTTSTAATGTIKAGTFTTGTATGLAPGTASGVASGVAGTTTTTPVGAATTAVTGTAVTTTPKGTSTTTKAATTTGATNPISGILGIVGSIFGINKRDEVEELFGSDEFVALLKDNGISVEDIATAIQTRSLQSMDDPELAKRDLLDVFYSQVIAIIGTNSNIEDIAESLDRSGLAINVAYNALVDSGWYDFDVNLVKYLVNNQIVTLLSLGKALWSSGVIFSVFGDIVGNTSYTKLVINFVIAILTGKVDVISLITALF